MRCHRSQRIQQGFDILNFINSFTDDINETPISVGLKRPRVKPYDGTRDPDDHDELSVGVGREVMLEIWWEENGTNVEEIIRKVNMFLRQED